MRVLGLVACGLLLVGCVNRTGPTARQSTTSAEPLTAAAALGDLRTVDYCSMFDGTPEIALSSFELCRTEVDFVELTIGPLTTDTHAGSEPYDYPDDLPPGVRISSFAPTPDVYGCVLWVGFADGVWLTVKAVDAAEPPWSTVDTYCAKAAGVVAGALTTIAHGRVGHVSWGPGSFSAIEPCPLITGPEFTAFGGSGSPKAAPSGHSCVNGRVTLSFDVDSPTSGTPATLGGREATVRRDRDACHVLFQRPLPGEPRFVEKATVTVFGDTEEACTLTRGAAELVAPGIPA
jgi:hypothetical protein